MCVGAVSTQLYNYSVKVLWRLVSDVNNEDLTAEVQIKEIMLKHPNMPTYSDKAINKEPWGLRRYGQFYEFS